MILGKHMSVDNLDLIISAVCQKVDEHLASLRSAYSNIMLWCFDVLTVSILS